MNKGIYVGLLGVVLFFLVCGNVIKNFINEFLLINLIFVVGLIKSIFIVFIINIFINNVDF